MKKTTNTIVLNDTLYDWYDSQFSISCFRNSLSTKNDKSNKIVKSIMEIVSNDNYKDEANDKYVVNIDDDTKNKIERGILKLDTNKNGEIYAQLRGSDGKYCGKLTITKELEDKGYSTKEVEMAMQMNAIQDVLLQILDVLEDIGEHVFDIFKGQQNDRAGLYYSGLNLLLESRTINDEFLKKQIVAQAIKAFSDANAQMIQQLRDDIQYLQNKKYDNVKGKRQQKIDEKISSINFSFDIIYRSSFIKAALYNEIGEVQAMLTALEEYGRFVEKLILPNSAMLTEMDKNDNKLNITVWEKRTVSLLKCSEVKKLLNTNNKVYYIDIIEE